MEMDDISSCMWEPPTERIRKRRRRGVVVSVCDDMDVADMLIEKIFCWVKLQKECADKLNKLATEREETKKNVNVSKVVGSSASVGGAAALTAGGLLTIATGGLAAPLLVAAGSVATAVGVGTNVASDVADAVSSSSTMTDAEKTAEKIKKLEERIQKDMESLKQEGERREKEAASFRDLSPEDYVVERILRAMAKRNKLELHDGVSLLNMMSGFSKYMTFGKNIVLHMSTHSAVTKSVLNELSKFFHKTAAKTSARIVGGTLGKAAGRIAGGAVGLMFSVPELVINCINLDKCETEESQSLRKNAKEMLTASEELENDLDEIQEAFQRLARIKRCSENTKRSSAEKKVLIEFAMETCKDEAVLQWLRENSESEVFFKLVDMFQLLKKNIENEEKENHSNNIDITLVAHGSITDSMIPASCLLLLPTITDVLLYSPWNCTMTAKAAYGVATGRMKPQHRVFYCETEKGCHVPDVQHRPKNLPNHWNSVRKAGDQMVPNITLSPFKPPEAGVWKKCEILKEKYGQPGRTLIVIPYVLPGKCDSAESVPLFIVTLALSLVLLFSRFTATVHLAASLGKRSAGMKLAENDLKEQYGCTVDNTGMTSSDNMLFNRHKGLFRAFRVVFD